jgi:integrase
MPRGDKDGSVKGIPARREGRRIIEPARWIVRRRFTNLKGVLTEKKRVAFSSSEATRVKRAIDAEIDRELAGAAPVVRARTFADLVTLAQKRELKPAEYSGDTKVAGLRSWRAVQGHLKPLEEWFGRMLVPAISYDDLDEYKRHRLALPTVHGRTRSIASVNRELALARRLFFLAVREKWIIDHPFHRGRPLIQLADEVERMRILSFEEEERLLEACTGRREHLRLQIVFALETAMRQHEQLTLKLSDIDFTDRIITLRAFNSKTAKVRVIPIFDRLARELDISFVARPGLRRPDELLFRDGNPKHAFENACEAAGIKGLRWHDLRHTGITRMLHTYGLQSAEVMKISGHSNFKTFLRYLNFDREMVCSIAARVDAIRAAVALPAIAVDAPAPGPLDLGEVTEVSQ